MPESNKWLCSDPMGRLIKIDPSIRPASDEEIEEVQKSLNELAADPSLTLNGPITQE